jgi:hypothetical protein
LILALIIYSIIASPYGGYPAAGGYPGGAAGYPGGAGGYPMAPGYIEYVIVDVRHQFLRKLGNL